MDESSEVDIKQLLSDNQMTYGHSRMHDREVKSLSTVLGSAELLACRSLGTHSICLSLDIESLLPPASLDLEVALST